MNEELLEQEIDTQKEKQSFTPDKEQYTVVDVRFRDGGKTYFFDPGELTLLPDENVVIDTARGAEFGTVVRGNHEISATEMVAALRKVIRKATPVDCRTAAELRSREEKALVTCQEKADELKLDMQLVSAEWAFDGSKLLFFFTSDGRVDFRELVKILASMFRTRIELRQIGVRDKAKMVGGLGICGRPFCCREFLPDFQPVSIKMAKTQNLSLNPTKISGTCGRLMCCLKYEQDTYEALMREAPKAESVVDTPDGRGTVTEVCLLKEAVKVRMDKDPDSINCYKDCDICVLRNGKAKKNDAPIPDDLAPISSPEARAARKKQEEELLAPVIFRDNSLNEAPVSAPAAPEAEKENAGEQKSSNRHRKHKRGGGHKGEKSGQSGSAQNAGENAPVNRENKPDEKKAEGKAQESKSESGAQSASGDKPKKHRRYYHKKKTT